MARKGKKRRMREEAEREELLAPDAFEESGKTVTPWLERNFRWVAGALAAALIGIIGFEYTRQSGSAVAAETTRVLIEGTDAYRDAVGLQAVVTTTTAEAREAALSEARTAIAPALQAPGAAGALAHLYDADLARRLGEHEAAVEGYDTYLAASGAKKGFDPLRFVAVEGKGMALEAAGRLDEALEQYRALEAMERFDDFGAMHVARILAAKGDVDGAKAAYDRVLAREPASPLASEAEQKRSALD